MSQQRMTSKIVKRTEVEAEALRLRKAGLTFEQIAVSMNLPNKGSAWKAVDAGLRKLIQEPAEEMRKLEVARLDAVLLSIWKPCLAGDLPSIDRFLKVQERRARLLGLDLPVKHELAGPGGVPLPGGSNVVIYLPSNNREETGTGDNGNGNGKGRIPAEAGAKGGEDGSRLPS